MKIGIIGGGIMGVTIGYLLVKQNIQVEIFEASPRLGGLADSISLQDGTVLDRFYHTILTSDRRLRDLCSELGLTDQLHFKETKMGFFFQEDIYPMNNMVDFFRFPPLDWISRIRLGITIIYAQFLKDWQKLEGVGVQDWLIKLSGKRTFDNIWKPMLKAKFDGGFNRIPATYIWSRLVRMKSTRKGVDQKEKAGYLVGGYPTLVNAMAKEIISCGGAIHLQVPVNEIVIENENAQGIRIGNEVHLFDKVVSTVQIPVFQRLIPSAAHEYHDHLRQLSYLGIICPLLVLDKPLTEFWTINITDDSVPFTAIVETTAYINPVHVGGYHLVYLPKYLMPGSQWMQKSDDDIREIWFSNLETMFPEFNRHCVRYFLISREKFVEPLHFLNSFDQIPSIKTPVENLYLATTAQIYPALTNSESVCQYAQSAVKEIMVS